MSATYKVSGATTWRQLDGEVVALETSSSTYFAIGGFGKVLWPRLVAGASKQELIDEITSTFGDIAPDHATADIDEFLATCLDDGLVVEAGDG